MSLLDLYADDIDRNYQQVLNNPKPPAQADFSIWSMGGAALTGVPRGLMEIGASGADVLSSFGTSFAATGGSPKGMFSADPLSPEAIKKMREGQTLDPTSGNEVRRVAQGMGPDPMTAHAADVAFHNATRVITKAVAGTVALGPVPGAAMVGLEEANTVTQDLINKGVDPSAAAKAGATQGAMLAGGILLPISGAKVAGGMLQKSAATAGLVAAGGPGAFMAQEFTVREILKSAGAHDEAETHDPTDPLGLGLSVLLPGVFAGASLRGAYKRIQTIEQGGIKLDQMSVSERRALKYNDAALDEFAKRAAIQNGVPPEILLALKNAGERSNSNQTSPAGAKGVMQFMPATAKEMGIKDLTDPVESIEGAARYIKKLHGAYGSWDAAIAHYNGGGTQAVLVRGGGKPSFKETADYLERVQGYVKKLGADSVVEKSPEVVDAARVKLAQEVTARTLPDHPEAAAKLDEVERSLDAGDIVETVELQGGRGAQPADVIEWASSRNIEPGAPLADVDVGRGNPFVTWLKNSGGVAFSQKFDIVGERGIRGNYAGIFTKRGQDLDILAQRAVDAGFLSQAEIDSAGDTGGTRALAELIRKATTGEVIRTSDQAMEMRQIETLRAQDTAAIEQMERELKALGVDPSPLKGNGQAMADYLAENRAALVNRQLEAIDAETQEIRAANGESFGVSSANFDAQSRVAAAMRLDEAAVERAAINAVDDVDFLNQIEDILGYAPRSTEIDAGIARADENARVSEGSEPPAITSTPEPADAGLISAQVKSIADESPDMLVTIPGQDTPVPLSQALDMAKREADDIRFDADLVKVAAECALMNA